MLDLSRRQFVALLGGAAAAWPLAARAQQREQVRRIGVLMNLGSDDAEGQARNAAAHEAGHALQDAVDYFPWRRERTLCR